MSDAVNGAGDIAQRYGIRNYRYLHIANARAVLGTFIGAGEEIVSDHGVRLDHCIVEGTNGGAPAAREIIFGALPAGPLSFFIFIILHTNVWYVRA